MQLCMYVSTEVKIYTQPELDSYLQTATGNLPKREYPSWLQATLTSAEPQKSSQTVPQTLLRHTSSLPVDMLEFPVNLTSPCSHTGGKNTNIRLITRGQMTSIALFCKSSSIKKNNINLQ